MQVRRKPRLMWMMCGGVWVSGSCMSVPSGPDSRAKSYLLAGQESCLLLSQGCVTDMTC